MLGSCDSFVVLPPLTRNGVIYGKNSDRPPSESQEIIYYPAGEAPPIVKCTYIEVEAGGPTKAVILSKPYWTWGAEMGANECGVVTGNIAIFSNNIEGDNDPKIPRLLGMDLVRLGLERSSSALEALEVITKYVEKYGQGGVCVLDDINFFYHNSFLIIDSKCVWVLEAVGRHWAAECITSGYRNISNIITINTKIDKKSDGILEYAKEKGFWNGIEEFNFAKAFSAKVQPGESRYAIGKSLLNELTASHNFKETDMFTILRNTDSTICRSDTSRFPTKCSQVSVIRSDKPSVHWFTATQNTSKSIFKPFVFTKNPIVSEHALFFNKLQGEPHTLYALHFENIIKQEKDFQTVLRNMETESVEKLNAIIDGVTDDLSQLDELFKKYVEAEVKLYLST